MVPKVCTVIVTAFVQVSAWPDAHRRHKFRPGDGAGAKIRAAFEKRQRRLMDVLDPDTKEPYFPPRADGKAIVNGETMDYSTHDCPWADSLDPDYPAMCLPYQGPGLNPVPAAATDFGLPVVDTADRDSSFKTPGGASLNCDASVEQATAGSPWIPSKCAMNAPDSNSPICEGFVEDCKYSTEETRKCTSEKCKQLQRKTRCRDASGTCPDGMTDCPICSEIYPNHLRAPYPKEYPGSDADEPAKCTKQDSALQWLMCGIPCPVPFPMNAKEDFKGLAAVVLIFIILSAIIGFITILKVKGEVQNFFVAGRSLPFIVVFATLGSQLFDASSALGNLDLGYTYHWWDGGAFPIGLGLSLILNGIFLAAPLNRMNLLTLPDLFARKYGPATEVLASLCTIVSFLFLLAGNLVGCGKILAFLLDVDSAVGIILSTILIWAYSCAGGLFSVAYTDIMQATIGWLGFIVGSIWIQSKLPGYPGVSPAYPLGDKKMHWEGMGDPDAYDPIPNAIMLNWATIIVLAFGNLMALDFQARCMAAKSPNVARWGCIAAGIIPACIGILNTYNSGVVRALYGPSSPHAEFVANSCSADITVIGCFGAGEGAGKCNAVPVPGVPTCGEWKPDPYAVLKMLTCTKDDCHYFLDFDGSAGYSPGTEGYYPMNGFIGAWVILGIVAASMSTADGAIVAMGTVFSHNLLRKLGGKFTDNKNLLNITRLSTLLWAIVAAIIASTKPNQTGYFLLVAFDIVFAGGVAPLFAAIYVPSIKPIAGFLSLFTGTLVRFILEFALPKDGLLLLTGKFARSFGPGVASDPELFDEAVINGKIAEVCPQEKLEDWTGVDSLVAPAVSLVVLVIVQLLPIKVSHAWLQQVEPPAEEEKGVDTAPAETEPKPTNVGVVEQEEI
mmetsp:Transcript_71807/g.131466  ORF Transcript_71807/g.131466 Transcript_71807/m.131466 type:complete len:897 (-) Transcript_71807:51-2741(-)